MHMLEDIKEKKQCMVYRVSVCHMHIVTLVLLLVPCFEMIIGELSHVS
jgi:hypothetical protein